MVGQPQARTRAREALAGLKGDLTTPVTAPGGKPPGWRDYAARGLAVAGHGIDYIQSPITGLVDRAVGEPVQKATGIPEHYAGDIAGYVLPFAPEIKSAVLGPEIRDGAKAVEKILSPTTVAPEAGKTERVIRAATGSHGLDAERAAHNLVKVSPLVGNMPVPAQRALVDYIENRATRAPLADPKLQEAADTISKVYDGYKTRIQSVLAKSGATPSFITDYYAHLWKEKPSIVADKIGAFARQGSGRSLKARTIPTISDGIAAGLTPKIENPVENTMAYARNMSNFLATHDIQNNLKDLGYAKFYKPGDAPAGWKPLSGILTQKTAAYLDKAGEPAGHQMQLYAPEPVARVYNNFISKGFEQGDIGPFWKAARHAANGLTMLKLGLSTFHLSTMSNEGIISEVARGLQAASRGKTIEAAKAIGAAPAAPVRSYMRGMKMQRELLDATNQPSSLSKAVNDAFVKSGGQLKMDPFYRTRASGSFFNAIERGTFKRELMDAFGKLTEGTPYARAKGAVDLAANVIQSTAAPMFEKFIPAIKRGAFASRMEDFLKANPNAPQEVIDKYAIKLQDSIDNRFGELVQDNLFWHRQMKQIAQILLLSSTWDLGTIREIGGGLKDLVPSMKGVIQGKGITDRTAYVAALAAVTALENGVATYLKTGTAPKGRDFLAYRTGGVDANSGQPERAMLPGYQKDVYAFGYDFPHHILDESANKLNPALTAATGVLTNKDYRGLPIFRPHGVAPIAGEPTPMDFVLDTLMPISMSNGKKRGSNLSGFERNVLAAKPAPGYIQSPERQEVLQRKFGTMDWKRRVRADLRQKARLEP
jgi:hypothetical protein